MQNLELSQVELELVKLALSEIAEPDSKWPGSHKIAARELIAKARGQHP